MQTSYILLQTSYFCRTLSRPTRPLIPYQSHISFILVHKLPKMWKVILKPFLNWNLQESLYEAVVRTGPVCSTDWTIQSIILRIKTRKATLNFSLKANYNPHILKAMMESGLKGLGQIRDRRIFRASQPIPYSNLNRIRCYNCLNKWSPSSDRKWDWKFKNYFQRKWKN